MQAEKSNFPFKIEDVEPHVAAEVMKYFNAERTGYVRVGPKKYFLPVEYKEVADSIYNMNIRADDVFVVSYPRSGTTLTQELVWMVANDFNFSNTASLAERYATLDHSMLVSSQLMENLESAYKRFAQEVSKHMKTYAPSEIERVSSPRYIKTHLPISLLAPNLLQTGKVVYVARDPRDVMVSYFHLSRAIKVHEFVGDFKTFWNFFINDLRYWTPYFEHAKEAWNKKNDHNLLFLFYEDIIIDMSTSIRRVAHFLNKNYSEEQIQRLCQHLNIENFRKNNAIKYNASMNELMMIKGSAEEPFIRKGNVGGWRDYFDEEMIQQTDKWMSKNLKDTDLIFPCKM